MAKTKNDTRGAKASGASTTTAPTETPEQLYAQAIAHLEQTDPEAALSTAQRLLAALPPSQPQLQLPALNLLGEVNVELGNVEDARAYFIQATELDPEGQIPEALGGGAEKFLWLAQLCEEGGSESVGWFEKGVRALQHEISTLENQDVARASDEEKEAREMQLEEKREKLAEALCAVAEVYMTDLSWEQDAEARCESLITEALLVTPDSPSVLQTLASIRLSQLKLDDARSALTRSISLWRRLDPEDPLVPDFPTRVSLARLLMEAEMEEEAMDVLERLALEDDESVEAAYLGGWCLHLVAEKKRAAAVADESDMSDAGAQNAEIMAVLRNSRAWLLSCLKLYRTLEYEDERLKEHAEELVGRLNDVLGPPPAEDDDEDEAEWDGIDDDDDDDDDDDGDDQEMQGM
ncbi:hypothetical protein AAFC00_005539 [Neodothiora populina]|uniref:TPR domain-containing protein n=1 Tax=Neodothiora populina TaxID=2781224 RepID=A0ABR3PL89_9PEZI